MELTIQKKEYLTKQAKTILKRTAQDIIDLSQICHEYRENFGYQDYIGWVENDLGLSGKSGERFLNVYNKFGCTDNLSVDNIQPSVLYLLSAPSTPEPARQEAIEKAESGETVTHKDAQELIKAHKRIEELESGKTPDLDNLIPELLKKYKGASITIGAANRLSVLDEESQRLFLTHIESKRWTEKENIKLSDDKLRVLEDLNKTVKERDELKNQINEISKTDTAEILLEKEKELQDAKFEYDQKLLRMRKDISKEASELHEQRFKDQITEAEKAKDKAEKKAREERDRAKAAWEQHREHELEIKRLKEQLEVDNPSNVDNAREHHVEDSGNSFLTSIYHIQKDMDRIGGGMENSIEAAKEVIKKASLEVAKLEGMQNAIITI